MKQFDSSLSISIVRVIVDSGCADVNYPAMEISSL